MSRFGFGFLKGLAVGGPPVINNLNDISGMEIWLQGSDASTVTVVDDAGTDRASAWASKVGSRVFSQATAGNQPEYVNGVGMFFAGDALRYLELLESTGLDWSDGTLVVAYDADDTSDAKYIFAIGSSGANRLNLVSNLNGDPTITIVAASSGLAFIDKNEDELTTVGARWNAGGDARIQDELGLENIDSSYATPTLDYSNLIIGVRPNLAGNSEFVGHIYEIGFWPRRLSDNEIQSALNYLVSAWGN